MRIACGGANCPFPDFIADVYDEAQFCQFCQASYSTRLEVVKKYENAVQEVKMSRYKHNSKFYLSVLMVLVVMFVAVVFSVATGYFLTPYLSHLFNPLVAVLFIWACLGMPLLDWLFSNKFPFPESPDFLDALD